jgi:uncharacterized membrane protein
MQPNLTRQQIKQRAKTQLRQPGVWGQMMVANILPWLITVIFTLVTVLGIVAVMTKFGVSRMALQPEQFATYYQQHSDTSMPLLKPLVLLWFTQGVAFTALDVFRGADRVRPGQAVMRLFNGQYFFGILFVWVFMTVLYLIGMMAFVIPAIPIVFGTSMSFYIYYDGKTHAENGRFSAMQAVGHSWQMMRGNKLDYFVLKLSLLGWSILKAITWHLFDFMINPYLQLVDAGFYENVQTQYAQKQTALN